SHDSYWQFHRDLFLELVPPPGRRTLDLGCGEGRLSRDLARLGHNVAAVDALGGAVAEAARVLEHGGRLCVAIVHPLNSAGRFQGDDADSMFVIDGSYLAPSFYVDSFVRDGLELELVSAHRP